MCQFLVSNRVSRLSARINLDLLDTSGLVLGIDVDGEILILGESSSTVSEALLFDLPNRFTRVVGTYLLLPCDRPSANHPGE